MNPPPPFPFIDPHFLYIQQWLNYYANMAAIFSQMESATSAEHVPAPAPTPTPTREKESRERSPSKEPAPKKLFTGPDPGPERTVRCHRHDLCRRYTGKFVGVRFVAVQNQNVLYMQKDNTLELIRGEMIRTDWGCIRKQIRRICCNRININYNVFTNRKGDWNYVSFKGEGDNIVLFLYGVLPPGYTLEQSRKLINFGHQWYIDYHLIPSLVFYRKVDRYVWDKKEILRIDFNYTERLLNDFEAKKEKSSESR